MKLAYILPVLAGVWAAPSTAAESYDNCTAFVNSLPAVISTQGTWCMNKDLSTALASGAAVTIATNNVVLDCNDFKLGNMAAGLDTQMTGIRADNRQNATIRNCNVRGFSIGVFLSADVEQPGGGHLVEDTRVEASRFIGIAVAGDGSMVRGNRVIDTGDGVTDAPTFATFGISVALGVDVVDNVVDGILYFRDNGPPEMVGIRAYLNYPGRIERNAVRGFDGNDGASVIAGIWVGSSGNVPIVDNRVAGPAGIGKGISCDSGGRARDNMVEGFSLALSGCGVVGGNDVVP